MPRKKKEILNLKNELTEFEKEFRKHLATFITGAFALVAALLWNDAIKSFLDRYQNRIVEMIPIKEQWVVQFVTAFSVTVIAVAAIIIVSKILKEEK